MGIDVVEDKIKVGFIASSGGHLEQLMMLKPLMLKYDSFVVTEKTDYEINIDVPFYYINQINREETAWFLKFIKVFFQSLRIFLIEKPDLIISTGALATISLCILSKLTGNKVIFIESYAKINSSTLTGRLIYKFADQFYVQWESMLKVYPNAIYLGSLY